MKSHPFYRVLYPFPNITHFLIILKHAQRIVNNLKNPGVASFFANLWTSPFGILGHSLLLKFRMALEAALGLRSQKWGRL
jgi:hypothetical protein